MLPERRHPVGNAIRATGRELWYTPKDIIVGARRNLKDFDVSEAIGIGLVSLVGGVVGLLTLNPLFGLATAVLIFGGEFKLEGSFVRRGVVPF